MADKPKTRRRLNSPEHIARLLRVWDLWKRKPLKTK